MLNNDNKIIALAGNPNVGKSTIFNAITGLNQHTGNWTGKTVDVAYAVAKDKKFKYTFVDLPGTYSLIPSSKEEEVSRDFIAFENPDLAVIVCDACCLERNLNLVIQTLSFTKNVLVCVNLLEEACKRNIVIDFDKLETLLNVPVISINAKKKSSAQLLLTAIEKTYNENSSENIITFDYGNQINKSILNITNNIDSNYQHKNILAEKLLIDDIGFINIADKNLFENINFMNIVNSEKKKLLKNGITPQKLHDIIISAPINEANKIATACISIDEKKELIANKIDKIVTSKKYGIPIMILLVLIIFWLTIVGSNYPSQLLTKGFALLEDKIIVLLQLINTPALITDILINGIYRVLSWVIAVMLPPMAIFFPLFTFLEDLGYLPRIAFNLDKAFKKCCACGKQGLSMCMGFGCNAVGVTGCRIIDSKRERLIAIITNSIVPCNGRFPSIIALISIFFVASSGLLAGVTSAFFLTVVILFSILMTFVCSYILSKTILKGEPSSFTLELPPYRTPQIGKILVRSCLDRTAYVLMRAIAVALPAGIIIYLFANFSIGGVSLLHHINVFFDPFGKLIGLDGVIITAFILGFPANEIVIPIILMSYMSGGTLVEMASLSALQSTLVANGWTVVTAVCFIIFSLIHFPCSTTLLTIKKETKSFKWTLVSFLYPTTVGIIICFFVSSISKLIF